MKVYEGVQNPQDSFPSDANAAGGFMVLVDGDPLPLAPSLKLRNHSPDGFSWGYLGSGPSQLSLALLLDALDNQSRAEDLYQDFKFCVVAAWPMDQGWKISQDDIIQICDQLEQQKQPTT
jgi:hypothetical protein